MLVLVSDNILPRTRTFKEYLVALMALSELKNADSMARESENARECQLGG